MSCPKCQSKSVEFEYAGGINVGAGLTCYDNFECLNCGHLWEEEIDCPDDDQDDQDDDQEPPSLPYLYGDGVYTSARPFRIVRRNDDYGH